MQPQAMTLMWTSAMPRVVVSAIAGSYHCLAVGTNGTVWAWGDNYFGELGDGTRSNR